MTDPIRELKIRAALLQRRIADRQPSALARLRALPEFRSCSARQFDSAATHVLRRHCLAVLARELGFGAWPHLKDVIAGAPDVSDFGTLLYPRRCCGYLNLWYSRYDDAVIGRRASGGYLLPYAASSWRSKHRSSRRLDWIPRHRIGSGSGVIGFARATCVRGRACMVS
jgi:hypothetical protein